MELKDQVCSLELALKLRELGVPQESIYWYSANAPAEVLFDADGKRDQITMKGWTEGDFVSAFTVAELGEILPVDVSFKLSDGRWSVFYKKVNGTFISKEADTEADARALCLIYLLENNLLTPTRKEGV